MVEKSVFQMAAKRLEIDENVDRARFGNSFFGSEMMQ